jgi:D-2-hydroxyacid dehydrogenase (NADP+)
MHRLALVAVLCAIPLTAQTKKIILNSPDPELLKQLQAVTPRARVVAVTPETVMQEVVDADGYIGEIKPAEVRAAKKLQWVQSMSAGVERVLHLSGGAELRDSNIILTNNQIVQSPEIADHALGMLLMLTRRLHIFYGRQQQELWQPRPYDGIELRGKNAVVIGVGGIGTQISVRAWACGMNVTGVDPEDIPYQPWLTRVVKPDQLDEVLPQADVIFVSAPWTPQSENMLGSRQFQLMKPGAYFIAVSRGGLYDLNALVQALDSKRLAGAGVDVTNPEPLPKGHPLWKFQNVIITPHISGRSDHDQERMWGTAKENLRRFVEGQPLVNVVDKQKGY